MFGTPAPKARPRSRLPAATQGAGAGKKVEASQESRPSQDKPGADLAFPRQRDQKVSETKTSNAATSEPSKPDFSRRREMRTRTAAFKKSDNGDSNQFKLTAKPNLFDPNAPKSYELPASLTEVRPSSPTKSILVVPGTARRKKAVNFHHSVETPQKTQRIRSDLPHEFPGKFPSPWTPRTGSTPRAGASKRSSVGSLEQTSKPVGSAEKKKSTTFDVNEDSRIEELLSEPDDNAPFFEEADLTADMNAPRSASGQYWKEHAQNVEGLALSKVEKLRQRCHTAIDYAKRKDEVCSNLGEKLREVMDKNQRLKDEIRRLHAGEEPAAQDEGLLEDALRIITDKDTKLDAAGKEMERMKALVDQYAAKVTAYEEMLDHREDKITELSMSMYNGDNGHDADPSEQVGDLKTKLRKAKQEIKELNPLRLECRKQMKQISSLEQEKKNLRQQLERHSGLDVNSSMIAPRSDLEAALRAEVDELEKTKNGLRAEMRQKSTEASKERREAEKALRAEIADLKSKLVMEELDRKELAREKEHLLAGGANDGSDSDWQRKHRQTLQELRQVKEELSALKRGSGGRARSRSRSPIKKATTQEHMAKDPSSPSDDSAIDRSYDRGNNFGNKATQKPQQQATNSSLFDLPEPPSIFQPDQPVPATPSRLPGNESSFATARRQKASPRPSIVTFNVSPAFKKRNVVARRPVVSKALEGMDSARMAAAERRIAERKAARKAARV